MESLIYVKFFLVLGLLIVNCIFSGLWFMKRRQAMVVDVVSHSVLPMLVLSYLFVGNLHSVFFVIVSLVCSFLMAVCVSFLSKLNLKESQQIMGVFFSGLFALGIILVNIYAKSVHLDADSVLFGALEFSVFENLYLFSTNIGPVAFYKMALLLIVNILTYKYFNPLFSLFSFDAKMLHLKGFNINWIDVFHLAILTFNIIFAFEVVGVVLTLALNVLPLMVARFYAFSSLKLLESAIVISFVSLVFSSLIAFSFSLSLSAVFVVFMFALLMLHVVFFDRLNLFKKTI